MNLIDILLKLQIPAWLVLILALAGTLAMTYYRYRIERRVKTLEYRLEKEAISYEKDLEFVQERHKKRLEALAEVNGAQMEFRHAFYHLCIGDSGYADKLKKYAGISRSLSRKYETLLGDEFYQAVKNMTDLGIGILQASFTLNDLGFSMLESLGLPMSTLDALRPIIGKPVPVTDTKQIVQGIGEEIFRLHQTVIFEYCKLSKEFNKPEYDRAELHLRNLNQDLIRTLPRPTSQGCSL